MRLTSQLVAVLLLSLLAAACGDGPAAAPGPADSAAADVPAPPDAGSAPDTAPDAAPDVPPDVPPPPPPAPADCRPNTAPFPERPAPAEPATLPFLRVEGAHVVDEDGVPVMLRGVNLGAWLMMENWLAGVGRLEADELLRRLDAQAEELGVADLLTRAKAVNLLEWTFYAKARFSCVQEWRAQMLAAAPAERAEAVAALWAWFDEQPWIYEERSFWRWFERRFGPEGAAALRATWHDHYVTETDIERVAALGLNLVRTGFWYQALETDVEGENGFVADGWRRLDQLVGWARKHRVYVMLDLHGAPGGQNPWWHQGLENGGFLWTTPACVDKTARLWQALARYFRDEPHVVAYDLLNEPAGAPDAAAFGAVHDALYQAVRAEDDRHIVVMEDGFLPPSRLVTPDELGWTNALMQFHDYVGGDDADVHAAKMEAELVKLGRDLGARYGGPVFYGEFNVYDPDDFLATDDPARRWQPEAMDRVLDLMNRRGVHWAPWSWKYFDAPSLWGVYHPATDPGARIDVVETSLEELRAAFAALDSANFVADPAYEALLRRNAAAPAAPLNLAPTAPAAAETER
jgi:aryl-phospho-beta-D-glucosidase BglC (GH1 family)